MKGILIIGQFKNDIYKINFNELSIVLKKNVIQKVVVLYWKEDEIIIDKLEKLYPEFIYKKLRKPARKFDKNIFYQMYQLEEGLKYFSFESLILKLRPDVFIPNYYIEKIFNLDYSIKLNSLNIFNSKVWVPYYEISKPFYFGDEVFCGYKSDLIKLFNYSIKYDHIFTIDSGISHIRRFIDPFNQKKQFEEFLLFFSLTGHGTPQRFDIFSKYFKNNIIYLEFLIQFLEILKSHFIVGIDNKKVVTFRTWNEYIIDFEKIKSFPINAENTFNINYGHIFCFDNSFTIKYQNLIYEHLNQNKKYLTEKYPPLDKIKEQIKPNFSEKLKLKLKGLLK